jgi:hypothetical protein
MTVAAGVRVDATAWLLRLPPNTQKRVIGLAGAGGTHALSAQCFTDMHRAPLPGAEEKLAGSPTPRFTPVGAPGEKSRTAYTHPRSADAGTWNSAAPRRRTTQTIRRDTLQPACFPSCRTNNLPRIFLKPPVSHFFRGQATGFRLHSRRQSSTRLPCCFVTKVAGRHSSSLVPSRHGERCFGRSWRLSSGHAARRCRLRRPVPRAHAHAELDLRCTASLVRWRTRRLPAHGVRTLARYDHARISDGGGQSQRCVSVSRSVRECHPVRVAPREGAHVDQWMQLLRVGDGTEAPLRRGASRVCRRRSQ